MLQRTHVSVGFQLEMCSLWFSVEALRFSKSSWFLETSKRLTRIEALKLPSRRLSEECEIWVLISLFLFVLVIFVTVIIRFVGEIGSWFPISVPISWMVAEFALTFQGRLVTDV